MPTSPTFLWRIAVFAEINGTPLKLSSNRSGFAFDAGRDVLFSLLEIILSSKPFVRYASYAYTQFFLYSLPYTPKPTLLHVAGSICVSDTGLSTNSHFGPS